MPDRGDVSLSEFGSKVSIFVGVFCMVVGLVELTSDLADDLCDSNEEGIWDQKGVRQ